jgi:hypothetical protein
MTLARLEFALAMFCGRNALNIFIISVGSICLGFGIAYPSPAGPSLSAALGFTKFERNIFNSILL